MNTLDVPNVLKVRRDFALLMVAGVDALTLVAIKGRETSISVPRESTIVRAWLLCLVNLLILHFFVRM